MSAKSERVVALTGANGFIALNTVLHFLQKGWTVRGSVRSQAKADKVKQHFLLEEYVKQGKLELVVVPSMSDKEALATFLEGASAFVHLATPVFMGDQTFDEYMESAKKDITAVFIVATAVKSIKAVSVMTTAATELEPVPWFQQAGRVYTESDVIPVTEDDVREDSENPMLPLSRYGLMKLRTEQWGEELHKSLGASFALSWMRPVAVYGPPLDLTSAADAANAGLSGSYLLALTSGKDKPVPMTILTSWVDARDIAEAFYVAVSEGKQGPYQLAAGDYDNQILANVARAVRPDLDALFPLGDPKDIPSSKGTYHFDNTKAVRELGIKFRTLEEMLTDSLAYMEKIGIVKSP